MEYGLISQPAFNDVKSVTHDQGRNIFHDLLSPSWKIRGEGGGTGSFR